MADRVGQQFGNYRLVALLGQGGFAEVYLGQHVRLTLYAAIKVILIQLTGQEAEHFQHKAQTIAGLAHPSIVRVLDFDVQEGVTFLVMDYAPHGSLRQCCPKGQMVPLPQIVTVVKQVAAALQHTHEHKVIHRDVKPENMLVGRYEEVLLSDFGIAKVAHGTASLSEQAAAGTIASMAPEQIQGHPRPANNQYALGVNIYEWLCGERPFAGSCAELITQHLWRPPPSLRERVPTISKEVVLRALAKDPKARFASLTVFTEAFVQTSKIGQLPSLYVTGEIPPTSQPALGTKPSPTADSPRLPSEPAPPPGSSGAPDQASQGSAIGSQKSVDLLEIAVTFEQLSEFLHTSTTSNGRTVLVSGEAGMGKTASVEQFFRLLCAVQKTLSFRRWWLSAAGVWLSTFSSSQARQSICYWGAWQC